MTNEEKDRMWSIDSRSQVGTEVSEEDKKWFNDHFELMQKETHDDYVHWRYNSGKFNIN